MPAFGKLRRSGAIPSERLVRAGSCHGDGARRAGLCCGLYDRQPCAESWICNVRGFTRFSAFLFCGAPAAAYVFRKFGVLT